jgi:hypothetical protein
MLVLIRSNIASMNLYENKMAHTIEDIITPQLQGKMVT